VLLIGDNPRFIVTSIENISPKMAYQELYCARGNDERYIKELKNDLACDRTSNSSFLANSSESTPRHPVRRQKRPSGRSGGVGCLPITRAKTPLSPPSNKLQLIASRFNLLL